MPEMRQSGILHHGENELPAKIDGNRHVIAQSIHTSELEALYCRKCGHPLPHNALEFDTVSLTA